MTEPLPGWSITGITHTIRYNTTTPGVGPIEGFDVAFTTTSGVAGSVFVAAAQAGDVDRVRAAIQQRVEQLHAIHTLTG